MGLGDQARRTLLGCGAAHPGDAIAGLRLSHHARGGARERKIENSQKPLKHAYKVWKELDHDS